MKRLTREERRRIQRRAANIRFLAFVLILLALGVCIGYTAAHAQDACEPPELQEVSQPSPVDDMPQDQHKGQEPDVCGTALDAPAFFSC